MIYSISHRKCVVNQTFISIHITRASKPTHIICLRGTKGSHVSVVIIIMACIWTIKWYLECERSVYIGYVWMFSLAHNCTHRSDVCHMLRHFRPFLHIFIIIFHQRHSIMHAYAPKYSSHILYTGAHRWACWRMLESSILSPLH